MVAGVAAAVVVLVMGTGWVCKCAAVWLPVCITMYLIAKHCRYPECIDASVRAFASDAIRSLNVDMCGCVCVLAVCIGFIFKPKMHTFCLPKNQKFCEKWIYCVSADCSVQSARRWIATQTTMARSRIYFAHAKCRKIYLNF